jgi:hypothetical protein
MQVPVERLPEVAALHGPTSAAAAAALQQQQLEDSEAVGGLESAEQLRDLRSLSANCRWLRPLLRVRLRGTGGTGGGGTGGSGGGCQGGARVAEVLGGVASTGTVVRCSCHGCRGRPYWLLRRGMGVCDLLEWHEHAGGGDVERLRERAAAAADWGDSAALRDVHAAVWSQLEVVPADVGGQSGDSSGSGSGSGGDGEGGAPVGRAGAQGFLDVVRQQAEALGGQALVGQQLVLCSFSE